MLRIFSCSGRNLPFIFDDFSHIYASNAECESTVRVVYASRGIKDFRVLVCRSRANNVALHASHTLSFCALGRLQFQFKEYHIRLAALSGPRPGPGEHLGESFKEALPNVGKNMASRYRRPQGRFPFTSTLPSSSSLEASEHPIGVRRCCNTPVSAF